MTSPYLPPPRRGVDWRMLRDYIAIALMLVSVIGIVTTLWVIGPIPGTLGTFAVVGLLGVLLGIRTTRE